MLSEVEAGVEGKKAKQEYFNPLIKPLSTLTEIPKLMAHFTDNFIYI